MIELKSQGKKDFTQKWGKIYTKVMEKIGFRSKVREKIFCMKVKKFVFVHKTEGKKCCEKDWERIFCLKVREKKILWESQGEIGCCENIWEKIKICLRVREKNILHEMKGKKYFAWKGGKKKNFERNSGKEYFARKS